jgi:hypothetical protein
VTAPVPRWSAKLGRTVDPDSSHMRNLPDPDPLTPAERRANRRGLAAERANHTEEVRP